MNTDHPDRNRLQFVLDSQPDRFRNSWLQHNVGNNLYLNYHPDLSVTSTTGNNISATLVGYMVDPFRPDADTTDTLATLVSEVGNNKDLVDCIDHLGGRWVLIFTDESGARLLGDAGGLRSVFYSNATSDGRKLCASQPALIAEILNLSADPDAIDFLEWQKPQNKEYWWPGTSSPYKSITRLLPNHCLHLGDTTEATRFWPRESLHETLLNASHSTITEIFRGGMLGAAKHFDLCLAMSAGWDSRLVLAASKECAANMQFYTSKTRGMASDHMDVAIPSKLLKQLQLPHDLLEAPEEIPEDFSDLYFAQTPFAHPKRLASQFTQYQAYNRNKMAVTGNVSEVARNVFKNPPPGEKVTPDYLMKVTHLDHPFARTQYENWLRNPPDFGYRLLDLFHWENRIGSWFAGNCLEFDLAWKDVFSPFNNRLLLIELLSVDAKHRTLPTFELYRKLMSELWPDVLQEPMNPKKQKVRKPGKIRKMVSRFFS